MYSPFERRQGLPFCGLVMSVVLVVGLVVAAWLSLKMSDSTPAAATATWTPPPGLTRDDVLPTPTIDLTRPSRLITFPGPAVFAPVIEAVRTAGGWETRYLGDAVGHLQDTAWLDDLGGNIVLAGHVDNAQGEPGPFAHLFEAHVGDRIILSEGALSRVYQVTAIDEVDPYDVQYLSQKGAPRLTLITCADWSADAQTYLNRLVVVAEPAGSGAASP